MNMLAQIQTNNSTQQVNMSSLELVDYINLHRQEVATTEKQYIELQHSDFLKKVSLVIPKDAGNFSSVYKDSQNRNRPCYVFPKREACLMAMSYSYELQARIFDRMTAMEDALKRPAPLLPDFTNPAEAARAWAEQFEAKQIAEQQIAVLAPKAIALDTIADTSNTYCLRHCAKTIGIRESDLIQLLIDKRWIYREPSKTPGKSGKLQPHAPYVSNKVFINRLSPVITNQYTGEERVHTNMRVTAFGLTRIAGLVNKVRKAEQVAA